MRSFFCHVCSHEFLKGPFLNINKRFSPSSSLFFYAKSTEERESEEEERELEEREKERERETIEKRDG